MRLIVILPLQKPSAFAARGGGVLGSQAQRLAAQRASDAALQRARGGTAASGGTHTLLRRVRNNSVACKPCGSSLGKALPADGIASKQKNIEIVR